MKDLLYKEFKLAAHPTTFIFWAFSIMILIPAYPYYVIFFYTALSLFFVFLTGRENKDIFYMATLPILKRDAVKARCWMAAIIELVQIIVSVPFAILSAAINPRGNLAGIDGNVAFFGLVFLMLSLFNIIFIPTFYKTAYKVGTAFLAGSISMAIFITAAESLVWIPSPLKDYLDTTAPGTAAKQLPVLIAGFAVWVLTMLLTYQKAASNFEKVDL
jgi:hypothetical protein